MTVTEITSSESVVKEKGYHHGEGDLTMLRDGQDLWTGFKGNPGYPGCLREEGTLDMMMPDCITCLIHRDTGRGMEDLDSIFCVLLEQPGWESRASGLLPLCFPIL